MSLCIRKCYRPLWVDTTVWLGKGTRLDLFGTRAPHEITHIQNLYFNRTF
jgi:hypothetical protein